MKYIRTKDGVYELKANEELKAQKTSNYFYINDKRFTCNLLLDEKYVKKCKQADTIEELCDGWIIECPEWDKPTFKRQLQYMNWQDYVKTANKRKVTHYACIFVKLQNGAIRIEPVAKMNEKGELDLL